MTDHFNLLLAATLICFPLGFLIRLLANKNLIFKDNPDGQARMAAFGKKLMILSLTVLAIGLLIRSLK